MKKWTSLILILVLLASALSCARNDPAPKIPVTFYYPAADTFYDGKTPVIHPEIRDGAGYEENMKGLLNLYLKGPSSEDLRSPFPRQVSVSRFAVTPSLATLVLSSEFAQLGGIDLTMACVCIANTVFELTGLDRIQISAADAQLDGQSTITLVRDDIYFIDTPQPPEETTQTTAASGQ